MSKEDEEFFIADALASAPPTLRRFRSLRRLLVQLAQEGWDDARVESKPHVTARTTVTVRPEQRAGFRVEIVPIPQRDSVIVTIGNAQGGQSIQQRRLKHRKITGPALMTYSVQLPSVDTAGRWLAAPDGRLVTAIGFDELLLDDSYVEIEEDGVRRPRLGAITLGGVRGSRVLPCGLRVVDGFTAVGLAKNQKRSTLCGSGKNAFAHAECCIERHLLDRKTPSLAGYMSECAHSSESIRRHALWVIERYFGLCDHAPLSGNARMQRDLRSHFGASWGRDPWDPHSRIQYDPWQYSGGFPDMLR